MTTSISAFVWLLVMAFALITYVVLDGYDLGIGMLLLTERNAHRRHSMMEIVSATLDGNEIWLAMVGVGIFAGFPSLYATLLPALYLPVILMLFSLGFVVSPSKCRENTTGTNQFGVRSFSSDRS